MIIIALILALLSATAGFADEDYFIPVPEKYWASKYVSQAQEIPDGEKGFVGNGLALDWPFVIGHFGDRPYENNYDIRRSLVEEFPEYFIKLEAARLGAELINRKAFDLS